MFIRERRVEGRTNVNYYMARRLGDMAELLNQLARALDDGMEKSEQLTKGDGLVAMQASATLMCDNCSRCNPYADSEKEDSCHLYYLLRVFEQKGHTDLEDMPQTFQSGCRKKEGYLAQSNRSLGRATMDLSWKNRFLESRDAVISQFRELSVILEGFSHQIDCTRDIADECEYTLEEYFKHYHVALGNLLLLGYENGQREAFLTTKTTNGRCITFKSAALVMGEVVDGTRWSSVKDSHSIITKQYKTVCFLEEGGYRMLYGVSKISRKSEKCSEDNYTLYESPGNQVVMNLSDGTGSGETAARGSKQVVEPTEQLLETGFPSRTALKLMNIVLLLVGPEQHPATLNLSCIDPYTSVLEVMKLGAMPTFIIGGERVKIMEAGEVLMGILSGVEPALISRELWGDDRIIMVSDRVLDALPGDDEEQAMQQHPESIEEMRPQELVDQVLDSAISFIPTPRDDMTVLTAGIWKRHP